jgi:hypothetical protein
MARGHVLARDLVPFPGEIGVFNQHVVFCGVFVASVAGAGASPMQEAIASANFVTIFAAKSGPLAART